MTASTEETSPAEGHDEKPPSPAEIETISQAVKEASTAAEQDEQDQAQVEEQEKEERDDQGAYYWDASTMAPLNASSAVST